MSQEAIRGEKVTPRTEEEKKCYEKRLNRIAGQINGINKMIDEDRYCADILIQISAATKALESLGKEILSNHMKTCMVRDIKKGEYESIEEVMDLFNKLS